MSEFIAPPCLAQIEILYQDEDILLINKPSGLLSLSGKNPLNLDSVHHRLVKTFASATLLHRLDFGTSGIMLVALNKQANGILTKQFQQRMIDKTYTAILFGAVVGETGAIDLPIAKDIDNFPYMKICHQTGKPAQSQFTVIERIAADTNCQYEKTRVSFVPLTGRTHQLRLHSQQIGHPILGCDLYANAQSQQMASRLQLHANTLSFIHPTTNIRQSIDCPCPF